MGEAWTCMHAHTHITHNPHAMLLQQLARTIKPHVRDRDIASAETERVHLITHMHRQSTQLRMLAGNCNACAHRSRDPIAMYMCVSLTYEI